MIKAPAKALTQAMLLAYCETNQGEEKPRKETHRMLSSRILFNQSLKDIDGLPQKVNICSPVAFPGLKQRQVASSDCN